MFINDFAFIGNSLWEKSIQNISVVLGENDSKLFTSNDYFYLTSIYYMNHPTLSELARKHEVTKPAISVIVRKLMKLELVEKVQSEQDRRVFTVQLTAKGKNIIWGDERQYYMVEELLKTIIPNEDKYHEFEDVVAELASKMRGEVNHDEA